MVTIDIILNKLIQYSSWILSELGIPQWLLLTITLIAIVVLTLIARQRRIAKLQKENTTDTENHSEIIGVKLIGRGSSHTRTEESKKQDQFIVPKTGEKLKGWGQTRKEWRKAIEQIKQLKREITKYKQTEIHNKQQLTELINTNKQLQYEIAEHRQTEKSLKKQIEELTTTRTQSQHALSTIIEKQTQQNLSSIEKTNKDVKLQSVEPLAANEQSKNETVGGSQTNQIQREDTGEVKEYKHLEAPIDVKEIKAVAELAKRLRQNNRQKQNK